MSSLLPDELHKALISDPTALNVVRIRRAWMKKTITPSVNKPSIRAAFIGSFTLDTIRDMFEVLCLDDGIFPHTFMGQYQQYPQEMLDPGSALYAHKPDITFLAIDPRSVFGDLYDAVPADNGEELRRYSQEFMGRLVGLIDRFNHEGTGLLVIHNLEVPSYDVAGIHAGGGDSITTAIRLFNEELSRRVSVWPRVHILDYDQVAARVGKDVATDEKMRLLGRFCVSNAAVPALAYRQIAYVKALKGLMRKCIVVDLDNTLWGGIVGEDGFDGIALGPTAPGNAFIEFQRMLLTFHRRGIILAINSRNNPDDALRVIREHPCQILREEHFGAIVINWSDKASNLVQISKELNIGLDALVFVDDDRHNRELVRKALPQVLTVELPEDPSQYRKAILRLNDLDSLELTQEDRQRGEMYAAERQRRVAQTTAADLDSFLSSLQIRVQIAEATSFSIPRISQLTQRTNQFNMTTRRYSPVEIETMAMDPNMRVICLSSSDRYGDNGIVGVAIVKCSQSEWIIDTFLMSCRVLGRGIEDAMLWWIANEAQTAEIAKLRGELVFTKKNMPARELYRNAGFKCIEQDEQGQIWLAGAADIAARKPKYVSFV